MKTVNDLKCDKFVSLRDLYWRYRVVMYDGVRGEICMLPHDHILVLVAGLSLGGISGINIRDLSWAYVVGLLLFVLISITSPGVIRPRAIMLDCERQGFSGFEVFMPVIALFTGNALRGALQKQDGYLPMFIIGVILVAMELSWSRRHNKRAIDLVTRDYTPILEGSTKAKKGSWNQPLFDARKGLVSHVEVYREQFVGGETDLFRYNDFKLVKLMQFRVDKGSVFASGVTEYSGVKERHMISDAIMCLFGKIAESGWSNFCRGVPEKIVVYGLANGGAFHVHWAYLVKYSFVQDKGGLSDDSEDWSEDWSYGILALKRKKCKTFCTDEISQFHIVRSIESNRILDQVLEKDPEVVKWPDIPLCR